MFGADKGKVKGSEGINATRAKRYTHPLSWGPGGKGVRYGAGRARVSR
jgi:hypothetical protein